ncbi:MAG: hypothetical protein OQK12_12805 [Motiliproteus sp.]|nr:hypothetical protein [Motiliproteus sp.]MCW9051859.1 hypothetical protein [Motiliproteus sp.]
MNLGNTVLVWVISFVVVTLFFYGLDHMVMSSQDLPLNLNLTPAQ